MTLTYPGESEEYRAARERLLAREVELRRAMEDVAAARRELPLGGAVPHDYVFRGAGADGAETGVRLRLRLVSSGGTTFNRDYHAESEEGSQRPMLNVFRRDGDVVRHFWGSELLYAPSEPGQDPRHVGTLEPLWNLFDLTPEGRDAHFHEQLDYCCGAPARR